MPSISQQDYIYIDVISTDGDGYEQLTEDAIRSLRRCAENGTLLSVVLATGEGSGGSRIVSYVYDDPILNIAFCSMSEEAVVVWQIPEINANNEEA